MANRSYRLWQIVLGALCACIVVLVVAIVVTNLNRKTDDNVEYVNVAVSMHTPEFEKINEEVIGMTFEEARAIYEEAIDTAPTELAQAQAKVEYGRYLMNCGYFEDGLNRLLNINAEILDAGYKILLYAGLRDYFYMISDDELGDTYNDMIGEVTIDSEYAMGD